MTEGGCSWVLEGQHVAVQDVNRLRRHLQSKLVLDGDLRARFISGLKSELEDDACLHRSLAPLVASAVLRHMRRQDDMTSALYHANQQILIIPLLAQEGNLSGDSLVRGAHSTPIVSQLGSPHAQAIAPRAGRVH